MCKIMLELENGNKIYVDKETNFKEIVDKYSNEDNIVLCEVNGNYYELMDKINEGGKIKFINSNSEIGWKIYSRTLQFIFIKVSLDLFPDAKIKIEHSISKGTFGELIKDTPLTEEEINKIKQGMKDLISRDIPINKVKVPKEKAIEIFSSYNMFDKVQLLNQVDLIEVELYELEGRYDYFYGNMAYSTGIIQAFDLILYAHGFVLRNPTEGDVSVLPEFKEQKKLAKIFYETEYWLNVLGVGEVGGLNDKVTSREKKELILISEALHEKKIA